MSSYNLYGYEVWGNEDEGFEVNNVYKIESYDIDIEATESDILKIIEASENVEIDNNCGFWPYALYFIDKNNGKPLGELRAAI